MTHAPSPCPTLQSLRSLAFLALTLAAVACSKPLVNARNARTDGALPEGADASADSASLKPLLTDLLPLDGGPSRKPKTSPRLS
jgi:hypothetical protein